MLVGSTWTWQAHEDETDKLLLFVVVVAVNVVVCMFAVQSQSFDESTYVHM